MSVKNLLILDDNNVQNDIFYFELKKLIMSPNEKFKYESSSWRI